MFVRDIRFFDSITEALNDNNRIAEMREGLLEGDAFIVKHVMSEDDIVRIRDYLGQIGLNSLPNYHKIEPGCPNFHRIDRWDPRANVKACVHSFSFFPWNLDIFGFFNLFAPIYHLKNRLSDLPAESFLSHEPDMGCTARISFHYYPRGLGGLNKHQDPFDYHQITVPTMTMSKKGRDYQEGGAYIQKSDSEIINLDDICDYGDVTYFNAQCLHGVSRIDPEEPLDWTSLAGRWTGLFAVNKIAGNEKIGNSKDLGEL